MWCFTFCKNRKKTFRCYGCVSHFGIKNISFGFICCLVRNENGIGPVYIQYAVKVVAFVLEDDGGEALNFLIHTLKGGNVRVTYADFAVALHNAAKAWNGKASFRARYNLSGKGEGILPGPIQSLRQGSPPLR